MDVSLAWALLNIAYLVYALSPMFKDIFNMRVTLLIATAFFMAYGIAAPVYSVLLWNVPVLVLHTYAIGQLVKARRGIDLDDEARAVQTLLFPTLNEVAFSALWNCGRENIVHHGDVLITQGEPVTELSLIMEGELNVDISGETSVRLGHIRLVGELSTLSGSAATATVSAAGTARLRTWRKTDLDVAAKQHREIETALLRVMGQEAARKLN